MQAGPDRALDRLDLALTPGRQTEGRLTNKVPVRNIGQDEVRAAAWEPPGFLPDLSSSPFPFDFCSGEAPSLTSRSLHLPSRGRRRLLLPFGRRVLVCRPLRGQRGGAAAELSATKPAKVNTLRPIVQDDQAIDMAPSFTSRPRSCLGESRPVSRDDDNLVIPNRTSSLHSRIVQPMPTTMAQQKPAQRAPKTLTHAYMVCGVGREPSQWVKAPTPTQGKIGHMKGAVGQFWLPEILGSSPRLEQDNEIARSLHSAMRVSASKQFLKIVS